MAAKIGALWKRLYSGKTDEEIILARIKNSKNKMCAAKEIAATVAQGGREITTKEVTVILKRMRSEGILYAVLNAGGARWGILKDFRCKSCNRTTGPSEREERLCKGCESGSMEFQVKWLSTPLIKRAENIPVWIYGPE